ncbi:DNA polymerase alpha subunit B-like [Argiope bruennichi]|uniref:DNA polymerase alpha subunit B n=1 Tax=Argiope bruennichi TaxID=94029 RepID=A0A8T0ED82_ARGBR|nr:DNA polymerase alpha subunit B-like [Argiope bruennichi]KAF8770821.1 DNA polymerase alpha subunit B like protein [Argiope bruennichi]
MDVNIEEIKEHLEEFCLTAEDDALIKMKELCFVYRLCAEDIVDQWIAFCTTKQKSCHPPSLSMLDQMEKEELMKTKSSKQRKSTSSVCTPVHNASTIDLICNNNFQNEKSNMNSLQATEQSPMLSPMTPTCFTPSRKYVSRSGVGDAVCSFGDALTVEFKYSEEFSCSVTAYNEETSLRTSYNFMCEKLRNRGAVLNEMIQDAADSFAKEYNIEEWGHIHLPSVETVPVIGRICSDSSGRLNATSVLLEGSQELSSGQTVPLDLSSVEKFSIFPGQIIAGTGINNLGKKLVLKTLFENTFPDYHSKVPSLENCLDSLGVVIAAGPFATADTMSYEPLWDLMKYVKTHMPHIVILIGPFVDIKNDFIENGDLNETYDDIFKRLVLEILKNIETLSTKVILVPSTRDAHHNYIYPTPPFAVDHATKRLYLASDPCILNIEGVIFAITSTDILFHLGKEEISYPQQPDRLGRLCKHLLTQKHFYPLYPSSEEINIDFPHYELHASLPVMPHVLIVPSDFRYFIKDINGCCCINPERLTKHSAGGTFARLNINRMDENKYKGSIIDCIQAQVLKI